ncbi:MAG TPA: hypothetical protein VGJ45_00460 [Pseudonocardiaceae bacterium]
MRRFSSLEPSKVNTAPSGTVNREEALCAPSAAASADPWAEPLADPLLVPFGTAAVVSDRADRVAPPGVVPATCARAYFLR